jgi:hypothetical protein
MNETAMKKHEIFNKLGALSGQELGSVADFIDFINYKKKKPTKKKFVKLQGILKRYAVDSMDITKFRQQS